jgi:hypothetical protein
MQQTGGSQQPSREASFQGQRQYSYGDDLGGDQASYGEFAEGEGAAMERDRAVQASKDPDRAGVCVCQKHKIKCARTSCCECI